MGVINVNDYSEDGLIEKPAIKIFDSLKYNYLNCFDETFGNGSTLGRETSSDVVLLSKLKPALLKLNPNLPPEAICKAIDIIISDRSIQNPANANKDIYKLLKEGVPVSFKDNNGEEVEDSV